MGVFFLTVAVLFDDFIRTLNNSDTFIFNNYMK